MKQITKKIGRNAPCPCGSSRKYKKCCINKNNANVTPAIAAMVKEAFMDENQRELKYGQVRPIIHTDFQEYKFVAVGDELHYSKSWKTFPDFLVDYAISVLGSDWGNEELKKPFDKRHQILKWYDGMCRFKQQQVKGEDGLYSCIPNGSFAAFIHLAYDLYILRHHSALQKEVIRRLKNKEQFQGARYELFASATCIRAGYNIQYEDESDVNKKHPEFIGIHNKTGQNISVEAKSRHRQGILDFKCDKIPESNLRAGIRRLLEKALKKPIEHPYIIFIDVNLPSFTCNSLESPWLKEIQETIGIVCGEDDNKADSFNLLVITNRPYHYGNHNNPSLSSNTLLVYSKKPKLKPIHPEAILEIGDAAKNLNIPNFFPAR